MSMHIEVPDEWSRLRLVSDGTSLGTWLMMDGKGVDNVVGLAWSLRSDSGFATLTVELENVEVDARALRVAIDGEESVRDHEWEAANAAASERARRIVESEKQKS